MEKRGNWKSLKSDLNITWPLISWATIPTSRWCSKVSAELREWKSQKQCLASSLCSISESSQAVFLPPSLLPPLPSLLPSFSLHGLSPWAFYGATKGIWFHPNCLNFQTLREFWVLAESQYWNRADHTVTCSFYAQIPPGLICPWMAASGYYCSTSLRVFLLNS